MRTLVDKVPFIAFGLLFALASLFPETWLSFALSLLSASVLAWGVRRSGTLYRDFFLSGILFNAVAFYWLPATITDFGGFHAILSYLIFAGFCVLSSLQFVFCGYLYLRLRASVFNSWHLALPLSWFVAEVVFPRMFPWMFANCLIEWRSVSGVAEYVGVLPLSLLLIWWGEAIATLVDMRGKFERGLIPVIGLSVLVLSLGVYRNQTVRERMSQAETITAALVQGNVEVHDKGNIKYLDVNEERYRRLSLSAQQQGAELLIWPESVVNRFVPEQINNVRNTEFDPFPQISVPLIYGLLSYRVRPENELKAMIAEHPWLGQPGYLAWIKYFRFNSAFVVGASGDVLGKYHKRVLMPFGEYLPLADRYPQLKRVSPQTGDLSKGDLEEPLRIPLQGQRNRVSSPLVKAGILICYEDLLPRLSGAAVQKGANLLVNLTNDAWYGKTAAPFQHHLLAQWRAIETSRYLLRVTNSGFTAVVDPFGRTVADLPLFEEKVLVREVSLIDGTTLYSKIGDTPVWIIAILVLMYALIRKRETRS